MNNKKILNSYNNSGQALIEILVALTISAVIISVVVSAVAVILKSTVQIRNFQAASSFAQDLADKGRIIAEAKWNDIYNLPVKTSTSTYFIVASGTNLIVVQGKEGVLGNDVKNGLIGHWNFDEATGTTAYDSSGSSNHGTINTGTSTINRLTGKVSNAINFDGADDYVDISTNIDYSSGKTTVAAWIKSISFCPSKIIVNSKRGSILGGFHFTLDGDSCAEVLLWLDFSVGLTWAVDSITQLNSNQWYHIVGSYDAITMRIYINGQLTNTRLGSGPMLDGGPGSTRIGRDLTGGASFDGLIDDVRIYNRALSADEIKRLYESGVFNRFFSVENVNRSGDDIVTSGGTDDPSTQKITSRVQWVAGDKTPEVKIATYLTRWRNFVFHQLDWVGGSGQDGPFTEPGNVFSTSTNTDYSGTPGSLKVQGF